MVTVNGLVFLQNLEQVSTTHTFTLSSPFPFTD